MLYRYRKEVKSTRGKTQKRVIKEFTLDIKWLVNF
jgi:hypothetical protein